MIIIDAFADVTQSGWNSVIDTTLALEDSASPATFSPASTPHDRWSSRLPEAFDISWTWDKGVPNSVIRTPSLVAALQELVNRHGAIDELVIVEGGNSGTPGLYHEWASYDFDPSLAGRLYVVYTTAP